MIEKIDFKAEVSKAPQIVQEIVNAGKLKVHEHSNVSRNQSDLFNFLTKTMLYPKFGEIFGFTNETANKKMWIRKTHGIVVMRKLNELNPGKVIINKSCGEISLLHSATHNLHTRASIELQFQKILEQA